MQPLQRKWMETVTGPTDRQTDNSKEIFKKSKRLAYYCINVFKMTKKIHHMLILLFHMYKIDIWYVKIVYKTTMNILFFSLFYSRINNTWNMPVQIYILVNSIHVQLGIFDCV